jgi:hypothetical protein
MPAITVYVARFKGGRLFPKVSFHSYELELNKLRRAAADDAGPGELPIRLEKMQLVEGKSA